MEGMKRVHVSVTGDVQGVGYRYTMRMMAEAIGAAGWVRNLADATVEAEIAGTRAQVDEMLAWMAIGPSGARVTGVEVTDVPTADTPGFHIRATE